MKSPVRCPRSLAQAILIVLLPAWAVFVAGCASAPPAGSPGKFSIGFVGDQHYDAESTAAFPHVMADMNRADLAFVVHVGDLGAPPYGSCADETYLRRRDELNESRHPLIYTPGDNEWTDCHQAGIPDSLERLSKLRDVFFQGDRSLGQRTLALGRQSADPRYAQFRENARWDYGGISFVTLHITGSNNNLGRTPDMDVEYAARNAANLEWLRLAFRHAKEQKSRGLMLLIHGNPRFEYAWPTPRRGALGYAPPPKRASGYTEFVAALQREVLAYDKPVALVHGDTHYFRVDKPIILDDQRGAKRGSIVERFTRAEVFGYPESYWVRADIDPDSAEVFRFTPEIVKRNARP